MSTKLRLNFYTDPGHGWLELPRHTYEALGISASRFSYYSSSRNCVYLEEDCDAPNAIEAFKAKGIDVELNELHVAHDIFIRKCFNIEDMPNIIGVVRS